MTISLSDAGKRFNREWIFRHFTYNFEQGKSYAIIGPNGSGKSTLLQVISGAVHISEGSLKYEAAGGRRETGVVSREEGGVRRESEVVAREGPAMRSYKSEVVPEAIYDHVSICAPYLEVVEEMTLKEFFVFHNGFKPLLPGLTIEKITSMLNLEKAVNKQIRYYSSGNETKG